jgi:hypothetical protein
MHALSLSVSRSPDSPSAVWVKPPSVNEFVGCRYPTGRGGNWRSPAARRTPWWQRDAPGDKVGAVPTAGQPETASTQGIVACSAPPSRRWFRGDDAAWTAPAHCAPRITDCPLPGGRNGKTSGHGADRRRRSASCRRCLSGTNSRRTRLPMRVSPTQLTASRGCGTPTESRRATEFECWWECWFW